MKTAYRINDQLQLLEFATDWVDAIGFILLSKKYIPQGVEFWIVTDEELEVLKNIPLEAWEVSGEPDGIGGLTESEVEEYKIKVEAFQNGGNSQQYEVSGN